MATKRCPDCRQTLPTSSFARNPSRPDGLQFYCRGCFSVRAAAAYRRKRARLGKTVRERRVVPAGHKYCPRCKTISPVSNWHVNQSSSDGWASYCKPCRKELGREHHLKRTFGLTPAQLAQLIAEQGGVCAICRTSAPIHIDHDHADGTVRGVLCGPCNMGLGQFRDDPALLWAARRYLREHGPVVDVRFNRASRPEANLADYLHGPAA